MKYRLTWGAGEVEQGSQEFDSLDAVRGMLNEDTDMNPGEIARLIETGKSGGDNPTQFDDPWIRMETVV